MPAAPAALLVAAAACRVPAALGSWALAGTPADESVVAQAADAGERVVALAGATALLGLADGAAGWAAEEAASSVGGWPAEEAGLAVLDRDRGALQSRFSSSSSTVNPFNVSACAGDTGDRDLCLRIDFGTSDATEVIVACRAHFPMPDKTPNALELFLPPHLQVQSCNTSEACRVFVSDGIVPGSKYYAFCACLHPGKFEVRPSLDVRPQCLPGADPCGLKVATSRKGLYHSQIGWEGLASICVLTAYVVWSYVFESSEGAPRLLHETGMAALVGLAIGAVFEKASGDFLTRFNYDLFSFILLPLVIFAAGFNLQHKSFWRYLPLMMSLGVLGTCLMFLFIFAGSTLRFKAHSGKVLELDVRHRLVMASVLSSTDTVAPMAFLPAQVFPRLYAVVFGEGVLNDVVSILLSAATVSADARLSPELAWDIVFLFVASGLVGLLFGLGISFMFRSITRLQEGDPLKPCALLVLGNYACYVAAEMCDLSSIFALFVSALACGHYAKHSMSDQGAFAAELAEFFAYVAEAFVFGYFGLTSVAYLQDPSTFSPTLVCFYIGCIFLSRLAAVLLLAFPLRRYCYRQGSFAIPKRELSVVALAGCMRGTIAFALVVRATPEPDMQRAEDRLLVTTVLGIVMVNAIFFGALFPVAMRLLDLESSREVAPVAENGGDAFRNRVHERWRRLDDEYLKPWFRKPEDGAQAARVAWPPVLPRRRQPPPPAGAIRSWPGSWPREAQPEEVPVAAVPRAAGSFT